MVDEKASASSPAPPRERPREQAKPRVPSREPAQAREQAKPRVPPQESVRPRIRPREADLLAAATRLFRARGFHATSMRDLGEALGMNWGSLYHYIPSKDDLLWLVLTRSFDLLEERVVPVLSSDRPAVERLRLAIRAHLQVAADHADELSLIQIELRSLGPERRAEMVARRDAYEALWRATIEEGVADGSLRTPEVRLAGIAILSACNWFTQWYRPGGRLNVEAVADGFADLYLHGLAAGASGEVRP